MINAMLDFIKIITLWLRTIINLLLGVLLLAIFFSPVLMILAMFYFSIKEDGYKLEEKCKQETLAQRPNETFEEIAIFCNTSHAYKK